MFFFDAKMEIDLADRLDDLICTFDKAVNDGPSDIFLAIVGWLLFAGAIFLAVGYIINNLRSTLSPANSVSTLDTKLSGIAKDVNINENTNSANHTKPATDSEHNICAKTEEICDGIKTSNTLNNELTEQLLSKNESFKTGNVFGALDPPLFSKLTEHQNGSLPTNKSEISSPEGHTNRNSDSKKGFLLNGKDSIEDEVSNHVLYHTIIKNIDNIKLLENNCKY